MSKKLKVIGLCLVAVCAFGAVSASAQAAVHWNVNGSALASGTEKSVAETVELEGSSVLTVSGLLRLSCTSLKLKGGKIKGTNTDSATGLEFSGCTVLTSAGAATKCGVKNVGSETLGTITTTGNTSLLKTAVVGGVEKAFDVFTPPTVEGKQLFATVEIVASGGTCALSGKNTITGTAALELATGTNLVTLAGNASAATAEAAGTALKYGERSAILDGAGKLKLLGGTETWGVGL